MADYNEMHSLIERLKDDAQDYEGNSPYSHGLIAYLKQLLENRILLHDAAIGSIKQAIVRGIYSLTKPQLKAIAIEMLECEAYISRCPNDWCKETISWEDMSFALSEGQCSLCVYHADKVKYE